MKRILFTASSPLVRNNGINTFMRETVKILRGEGHIVDFITDNPVDFNIEDYFNNYFCPTTAVEYPEMVNDGIPNILYLPHITNRIRDLFNSLHNKDYDIIISNDVHCSAAFIDHPALVHYVHTAALCSKTNYTFLSDSYIQMERDVMKFCKVAVPTEEIKEIITHHGSTPDYFDYITLGLCLTNYEDYLKQPKDKSNGIMFIGEGTYRKGADLLQKQIDNFPDVQFNTMLSAFQGGVTGRNVTIKTFGNPKEDTGSPTWIDTAAEKSGYVRSTQFSYFPSRSETIGYGVLEAMLSQPVFVHEEFAWTKSVIALGAKPTSPYWAKTNIQEELDKPTLHDPKPVIDYFERSKRQWIDFANS